MIGRLPAARPVMLTAVAVLLLVAALAAAGCRQSPQVVQSPSTPTPTLSATSSALPSPTPAPTISPSFPPATLARLKIVLKPMWRGFDQPLDLVNAGDGSGRLFVAEQTGFVREIANGKVVGGAYLDLSNLVLTGGERGLLGVAFSPGFKDDGRVYVNYTDVNGDTIIARYTAENPASLHPTWSRHEVVLRVGQPYPNHNGGDVVFGPDKMLYIGMGDGGSEGDPNRVGQNLGTLLGKMLRIDTGDAGTGTPPARYRIPPDNPFVGRAGARPEIWAYGLRNPWRYSFDASGGALWIADVGQDAWEEVDLARPGVGGQNWGWSRWEGTHRYPPGAPPISKAGYSFPIVEYPHPLGESITGGYVYRGLDYPALVGTYLYADYVKGWVGGIRTTSPSGTALAQPETRLLLRTGGQPASFGVDERGELYLVDHLGTVYQVTATAK